MECPSLARRAAGADFDIDGALLRYDPLNDIPLPHRPRRDASAAR
jgi:hypothetical protein